MADVTPWMDRLAVEVRREHGPLAAILWTPAGVEVVLVTDAGLVPVIA